MQRMTLDLDTRDAALLEQALERVLQTMQAELVHTDDRQLQSALRADLEQLERLAARIHRARE